MVDPVVIVDRVCEEVLARQPVVVDHPVAGPQVPPEVGVLDGAREGRGKRDHHAAQEERAGAEPGGAQRRTGQKGTSIGTRRR